MASNYDHIRQENIRKYGEETRHLAFLGRLYSDRTHFVYELLQNAEDAEATQVLISLHEDRLEFLHNGMNFNEADVRGICGVGEGTKPEDLTKIGKFGIGFKSVYAYTTSPEIHCGNEHFRIEYYVRPHGIGFVDVSNPWTTKFVLPFNTSHVSSDIAFAKIAERLMSLNVRTLLFLRNISEISWETDGGDSGIYLRDASRRGASRQITVIGQRKGEEDEEESWLVFERAVIAPDGCQVKPVEIAYRLEITEEGKSKKEEAIVPLHTSPLFVFFTTEKDTRLGFLVQGPYKTTPARDNIPKDDTWNTHLVEEAGQLVVDSLQHLKSMGLLTVRVLDGMPIQEEDFLPKSMFRPIYDSVVMAITEEELLPAETGGFISARGALIGRGAEIRSLLSAKQLAELSRKKATLGVSYRPEIQWLSGAITQERTPTLREYLINQLEIKEITPDSFARRVRRKFFVKQEDAWLVEFYRFLLKQEALWRESRFRWDSDGPIRHKPFIRLEEGRQVRAFGDDGAVAVYLPGKAIKGLPSVKSSLLAEKEVREFFSRLGIREPDVVSEVIENVLPFYKLDEIEVTEEQHADHISLIIQALQVDSVERRRMLLSELKECNFLFVRNAATGDQACSRPEEVYLRTPDLEIFLAGNPDAWFLDERYSDTEEANFVNVGVRNDLRVSRREADCQGYVTVQKYHGWHQRGIDEFDPECWVEHLDFAVHHPTEKCSLFIWQNIARPLQRQIRGTLEKSTRKDYGNSEKEFTMSKLGRYLITEAWVPNVNKEFHKPEDLSLGDLPGDFEADVGLAGNLRMKGSELTDLARKAGLDVGDLDLIRELKGMPEEFQYLKHLIEKRRAKPRFPGGRSKDPKRRIRQAGERAGKAPEKKYGIRPRKVRTSSLHGDKATYLRQSYTNEDSELICQMCEDEMPFRRRDGEYYFEAVQLFDDLTREHEAAHLALCPLCAAKFKEFVKRDEKQQKDLRIRVANEEELEFTVELGEKTGSIRFVEKHFIDIQGLIAGEEE